jgi:hypothetical protein
MLRGIPVLSLLITAPAFSATLPLPVNSAPVALQVDAGGFIYIAGSYANAFVPTQYAFVAKLSPDGEP